MIVSRGLGQGLAGALVAAGLCLSIPIVIVPTPNPEVRTTIFGHTGQVGKVVPIQRTTTRIILDRVQVESLFEKIEVSGKANLVLLEFISELKVGQAKVSGKASAKLLGVSADTALGALLTEGKHDLSDEELLSMILGLIV